MAPANISGEPRCNIEACALNCRESSGLSRETVSKNSSSSDEARVECPEPVNQTFTNQQVRVALSKPSLAAKRGRVIPNGITKIAVRKADPSGNIGFFCHKSSRREKRSRVGTPNAFMGVAGES